MSVLNATRKYVKEIIGDCGVISNGCSGIPTWLQEANYEAFTSHVSLKTQQKQTQSLPQSKPDSSQDGTAAKPKRPQIPRAERGIVENWCRTCHKLSGSFAFTEATVTNPQATQMVHKGCYICGSKTHYYTDCTHFKSGNLEEIRKKCCECVSDPRNASV